MRLLLCCEPFKPDRASARRKQGMPCRVAQPASVWPSAPWYDPRRPISGSLDGQQYHQLPIAAREKTHGVDGLAGVPLDTPRGLKSHGCSGDAPGAPSRSRLKGRPQWDPGRQRGAAWGAHRPPLRSEAHRIQQTLLLFPVGTMDHGTANRHAVIAEGELSSGPRRADWEGNGATAVAKAAVTRAKRRRSRARSLGA